MSDTNPLIAFTQAETRQLIDEQIQALNKREAQARADYENEMQRIEERRAQLEEMWRKTYEND